MNINKILNFQINHIGVVINPNQINSFSDKFIFDPIQKVHVSFKYSEIKKCYIEYITKEGRAKNYNLGFNHICYNVENIAKMEEFHKFIIKNNLGIRLTLPEKSILEICNYVTFYKLEFIGIVEFNIIK